MTELLRKSDIKYKGLISRIFSSFVMFGITLAILFWSNILILPAILVIMTLLTYESIQLALFRVPSSSLWRKICSPYSIGFVSGLVSVINWQLYAISPWLTLILPTLAGFLISVMLGLPLRRGLIAALSTIYAQIACFFFLDLYTLWGTGFWYITLAYVMITDTGCFIVGRMVGGPKLAPRISPSKTFSGALGGFIAACLAACAFYFSGILYDTFWLKIQAQGLFTFMIWGGFVSIVAQAGDLIESMMKRYYDVKDSSQLIPGHGGVFDRLDSVLLVSTVLYGLSKFWL